MDTTMTGHPKMTTNTGCSWPDWRGEPRTFKRSDVVAFGKSMWYGSNVTYFWVRLTDGTYLGVKASAQTKENKKWLAGLSKRLGYIGSPDRHVGEVFGWLDSI